MELLGEEDKEGLFVCVGEQITLEKTIEKNKWQEFWLKLYKWGWVDS